jgi:AraC-like DNA-binding protein
MDTVSHLLRLARFEASLDRRCLLSASTRMEVPSYGPREVPFHVLLEGECRLQVGSEVLDLRAGDVVMLPRGSGHRVTTTGPGVERDVTESAGRSFLTTTSSPAGAPAIDLFCGHFTYGPGAGALLFETLPDTVHVAFGQSGENALVLQKLSDLMRAEAHVQTPGTQAILSALCTVLLTMVLRTVVGSATTSRMWTAVDDSRIATTVEHVLAAPGENWSIDRLSESAAMSRATFLRRFARSTGMTVGAFLMKVRLMAASEMLLETDATVSVVAAEVGYRSESAFSRAFRLATGTTPARFRRAEAQR